MNAQDIRLLYEYNDWANQRILNAAAQIADEQFLAPAAFSHGGLRGALTHILFAEWVWRKRWLGESPAKRIEPEEFPNLVSLRARWREEQKALSSFLTSLTDEKLNAPFQYKNARGEPLENILWHVMAHLVNHGTQHRGEAAAMLTEFGRSPGDIDFIVFLRETKQ